MSKIKTKIRTRASFVAGFRYHCLEAIQLGYDQMLKEKRYQVDYEEDNLTICLVETIKKTNFLLQFHISVNHQSPIYDEAMAYEGASPLKAPKVDFKFSKFGVLEEHEFYAEAKNLSENNWQKTSGSTVDASHYRARYIDTGIENYLLNRYPEGCLVGYVVNGREANIIAGLNKLIDSRGASPRIGQIRKDTSVTLPICYISDNQSVNGPMQLRHLFLQLA